MTNNSSVCVRGSKNASQPVLGQMTADECLATMAERYAFEQAVQSGQVRDQMSADANQEIAKLARKGAL